MSPRLEYYLFNFSQSLTFHKKSEINKRVSSSATSRTYNNALYMFYVLYSVASSDDDYVNFLTVEFRSKVACENEVVNLQCNPNSRLAMFSASYGRTEYESIQCPQPQGVPEESKYIIQLLLLFPLFLDCHNS